MPVQALRERIIPRAGHYFASSNAARVRARVAGIINLVIDQQQQPWQPPMREMRVLSAMVIARETASEVSK